MTSLTPQQHRMIAAISTGSSISQAAAAENLRRNTVGNRRLTNPNFSPSLRFRAAAPIVKMRAKPELGSFIPIVQTAPEIEERAQTCTTEPKLASFIPNPETTESKENPGPANEVFDIRQAAKVFVHAQRCTKPQPTRRPETWPQRTRPCSSGLEIQKLLPAQTRNTALRPN